MSIPAKDRLDRGLYERNAVSCDFGWENRRHIYIELNKAHCTDIYKDPNKENRKTVSRFDATKLENRLNLSL